MKKIQRFWYGNIFYRLPRTIRTIGFVGIRDGLQLIGPFGIAYRTYDHHRFNTPIMGREKKIVLRVAENGWSL